MHDVARELRRTYFLCMHVVYNMTLYTRVYSNANQDIEACAETSHKRGEPRFELQRFAAGLLTNNRAQARHSGNCIESPRNVVCK